MLRYREMKAIEYIRRSKDYGAVTGPLTEIVTVLCSPRKFWVIELDEKDIGVCAFGISEYGYQFQEIVLDPEYKHVLGTVQRHIKTKIEFLESEVLMARMRGDSYGIADGLPEGAGLGA